MKYILFFFLTFPALACSELGPMEFKPKPETLTKCGKMATQYALEFARTMISIESKDKNYSGPKELKAPARGAPRPYRALAPKGGTKQMGFNVSLDHDKWECNFCVDFMMLGEDCRVTSITKFMCAN